jgi:hypothetical protein
MPPLFKQDTFFSFLNTATPYSLKSCHVNQVSYNDQKNAELTKAADVLQLEGISQATPCF